VDFSEAVKDQINEEFSTDLIERACQILRPEQGDRVLRAVLKLSRGDLDRLQHFSDVAATDERDVLTWAESPSRSAEPASYGELRERLRLPPES
jgi:hypothetical protein